MIYLVPDFTRLAPMADCLSTSKKVKQNLRTVVIFIILLSQYIMLKKVVCIYCYITVVHV
jgi:hypothetical protein